MGRKSGVGLLKLGLKRPKKRLWISHGFGSGYYMYRTTTASGQLIEVREWKDGSIEDVPIKTLTLKDFGLVRAESGRIFEKHKVV